MTKQSLFLKTIALFLLLAVLGTGALVEANPIPYPATPSQEKPTLTIKNMQNDTIYGVGAIMLDFSVVPPDAWTRTYDYFFHIGYVSNVSVALDGKQCGSSSYNSTDYSFVINQTALGMHKIQITVFSCSYYLTPVEGMDNIPSKYLTYDGVHPYEYWTVVSDTVYYTTSSSSTDFPAHIPATSTPSPSQLPTNVPTNNPTPNRTSNSNSAIPTSITLSPTPSPTPATPELNLAAIIMLLAVASVALVYYKTHGEHKK